jgi:sulfite exporter TauE/SafE
MMIAELLPLVSTAFLAGLLGAGHCFGMCGGIASGLGVLSARRNAIGTALVFNGARILSYVLLGGLAAFVIGQTGDALSLPVWSRALRWASSLLIALVGLQFLFNIKLLGGIEKAGAGLWARISPVVQRAAKLRGVYGRAALGICWGLLPCGLVYTILLTAASTGKFYLGAVVMLAFGLGTLPALMGLTIWAPALATFLQDRSFRRIIGLALIFLAVWAVLMSSGSVSNHTGHG